MGDSHNKNVKKKENGKEENKDMIPNYIIRNRMCKVG